MIFVFRTEASSQIGAGHVMRCLALADELRAARAEAHFICREYPGNLCDTIAARGHSVHRLPVPSAEAREHPPAHTAWPGAGARREIEQARAIIDSLPARPRYLVFDHYGLDAEVERALRACADGVLVIDDLADRAHDCDLLLDQNLVHSMHERYRDRVPAACRQLLGPRYSLLQPLYAELHDRARERAGPVRRIMVFFSGADVDNLTGLAVDALRDPAFDAIEVDVVTTSSNRSADALRLALRGQERMRLHVDLPSLAPLMARADLAIGAGGASSWERACLGLPSLVITLADNQRPIAQALDERGIARWLGHKTEVTRQSLARAVRDVVDRGLDGAWSRLCAATVDGRGASRVRAAMMVDANTVLSARPAAMADGALLLDWANDPSTRANAFSAEPIATETHYAWLGERLRQPERCHIYIIEADARTPVGQVRFDRKGEEWEIDYAIAPYLRGRGLGRALLDTALRALRAQHDGGRVLGRVKDGNVASRKVFESLSFDAQRDGQGFAYRRAL